jgi:hypothetical protein
LKNLFDHYIKEFKNVWPIADIKSPAKWTLNQAGNVLNLSFKHSKWNWYNLFVCALVCYKNGSVNEQFQISTIHKLPNIQFI